MEHYQCCILITIAVQEVGNQSLNIALKKDEKGSQEGL